MKAKILFFGILTLFWIDSSHCQQWIRVYGDTVNTVINSVFEHYDKGYILSGKQEEGWTSLGWLMKTDINGYARWEKSYGQIGKISPISSSRLTFDGGIIVIGGTNILSTTCNDPLVIKIDACGDKEWCKVYKAPGCNGWGTDIELISDSGYIALMDHWKSGEEEAIWLFRLDSMGNVIWAQAYATDPIFSSEWSHSLEKTTDDCVLITGEAYYPDPTYPGKSIIKIILIKVTLDGDAIFEVPWGTDNGVYSDGRLSVIDSKNNIYTAGRRARTASPYGDSPCLFKTSSIGDPVYYSDLKSSSTLGIATTVNWFQDSTLALCSQWRCSIGIDTTGVIKTDSLGNFLNQIAFQNNYGFYASTTTSNNRLLLGGASYASGHLYGCAIKLTSDLEYDSVYTTPITYDSLCSHPIVSDTISLSDCQSVVVDIDDPVKNPEKTRLRIYPNPADHIVTVEMPEYLVRQSAGNAITATTYYYRWKSVRLDVFDLHGKLIYSQDIAGETKQLDLEISSWPAGMYLARLVFMNEVVAGAKFVKK
jgi:hypothetical protein